MNATKNEILHIAIHFFSQRGYRGVSIRQITKEVGIKESSLYKHFQNKDEILATIFFNFRIEIAKILPPQDKLDEIAAVMSPIVFLEHGLANFKAHIDNITMQRIWRIIYIEMFCDPMAREIYYEHIVNRTIDCLEIVFSKMIALKKIRPLNPRMLAIEYQYCVFELIKEYNLLKFEDKSTDKVEQKLNNHIIFFVNAITADQ